MNPPPAWETGGGTKNRRGPTVWVIAAIVASILVLCLPLGPSLFRTVFQARQRTICLDHLRLQASALLTYAADHDDRLPPGSAWMDAIVPSVAPDTGVPFLRRQENAVFRCPALRRFQHGYAFNERLSLASRSVVSDPGRTPLTFDSMKLGRNETAWPPDAPPKGRHGGRNNFSFLDGHVASLDPGDRPWSGTEPKSQKKTTCAGTNPKIGMSNTRMSYGDHGLP